MLTSRRRRAGAAAPPVLPGFLDSPRLPARALRAVGDRAARPSRGLRHPGAGRDRAHRGRRLRGVRTAQHRRGRRRRLRRRRGRRQHRLRDRPVRRARPGGTLGQVRVPDPGTARQGGAFFDRHGGKIITIARFIEGLRQANGIIAGITGMHWLKLPRLQRARRGALGRHLGERRLLRRPAHHHDLRRHHQLLPVRGDRGGGGHRRLDRAPRCASGAGRRARRGRRPGPRGQAGGGGEARPTGRGRRGDGRGPRRRTGQRTATPSREAAGPTDSHRDAAEVAGLRTLPGRRGRPGRRHVAGPTTLPGRQRPTGPG